MGAPPPARPDAGTWLRSWLHTARIAWRNVRGRKLEAEIPLMRQFVRPGHTCLHIGASDGRHTYELSRLAGPRGVVHCFEPAPYTRAILARLRALHGLDNVHLHAAAMADTPGRTRLHTPVKANGHLGLSFAFIADALPDPEGLAAARGFRGFRSTEVEVTTVDDFCTRAGLGRVDFVRCDIEGAEMRMLAGARGVLWRDRPVLLEVHPHALSRQFGSSADAVRDLLADYGYRFARLDDGRLVEVDRFADEPWRDYYCLPPVLGVSVRTPRASQRQAVAA